MTLVTVSLMIQVVIMLEKHKMPSKQKEKKRTYNASNAIQNCTHFLFSSSFQKFVLNL